MSKSTKQSKKVAKKPARSASERKERGPTITSAWVEEFAANEGRAKEGKRPLTDEQIVERMQARFPDKKNSTTITRISQARGTYNKGTSMFAKLGPSGKAGRPVSRRYDVDGSVVEAHCRPPSTHVAAQEGASPKAPKKVAKAAKAAKVAKAPADATPHHAEAAAEADGN